MVDYNNLFKQDLPPLASTDMHDLANELIDGYMNHSVVAGAIKYEVYSLIKDNISEQDVISRSLEYQKRKLSGSDELDEHVSHVEFIILCEDEGVHSFDLSPIEDSLKQEIDAEELHRYLTNYLAGVDIEDGIFDSDMDYDDIEDQFEIFYDCLIRDLALFATEHVIANSNISDYLLYDHELTTFIYSPTIVKFNAGESYSLTDALDASGDIEPFFDFCKLLNLSRVDALSAAIKAGLNGDFITALADSEFDYPYNEKSKGKCVLFTSVHEQMKEIVCSSYSDLASIGFSLSINEFLARDLTVPLTLTGSAYFSVICPINGGGSALSAASVENYQLDIEHLHIESGLRYTPEDIFGIGVRDYRCSISDDNNRKTVRQTM